ncbi:uncharacterized protein G2W53_019376 [Senna tora]|uniref:Uncharacterized protein n=1 Tax=Senna tora TaxID=362788 RepID=A0A834TU08_9FABA|nr:uncharacterized protein G2W53_019376 [Senna tora]
MRNAGEERERDGAATIGGVS